MVVPVLRRRCLAVMLAPEPAAGNAAGLTRRWVSAARAVGGGGPGLVTPPQQMNAEVPRWVSVSVAVRPSADASGWGRAMVNVPAPVPPTAWLAVPANVL